MTTRSRAMQAARAAHAAALVTIGDRYVHTCEDASERYRRGREYLHRRLDEQLAEIAETHPEETTP